MTWETAFTAAMCLWLAHNLSRIATNMIALRRAIRRGNALQHAVRLIDRMQSYRCYGAGPQRLHWAMNSLKAAEEFLLDEDATWTQLGMAEHMLDELEKEPMEFWN